MFIPSLPLEISVRARSRKFCSIFVCNTKQIPEGWWRQDVKQGSDYLSCHVGHRCHLDHFDDDLYHQSERPVRFIRSTIFPISIFVILITKDRGDKN